MSNNWTPEQYQAIQNQNMMGGPNGNNQQNFIGPIPPETQDSTMDLTQDDDRNDNGDKSQGRRDSRWTRNRDRDNRDSRDNRNHNNDRGRNDRGRGDRERDDRDRRDDRSRSNRGRDRSSRFTQDPPQMPGLPGLGSTDMAVTGMGVPNENNMQMMPGMMQSYGNMMPGQPQMGMPNMMPGMNGPGTMLMPGQMAGMMPGMMTSQMQGHMPGQMPGAMPGQMHGQMPGQMPGMMDQNMMAAQQIQMINAQPLFLQAGVLLPPFPGTSLPSRREKPANCRTIFVGGLPPGLDTDTIKEIFQRFGDIDDVKIHKQGVCHVRFMRQEMVEMSFFLSGFRFKLHDQTENEATSLFIDYALNREDQNEDRRREPTPPRVEPYSAAALTALLDKIKSDTDFAEAAPTLAGWLEKGECNKKNANVFYSLIQACNSQVRRLYNDKMTVDEEYINFKSTLKDKFQLIIFQFEQVAKILSAAKHKKTSDHFSKQQRRNVDMWFKMTEDLANLKEEFNMLFDEDEHEKIGQKLVPADKYEALKSENDVLICELEGYKNEAHLAKDEAERKFEKFKAQYIAQQALQGGRVSHQQGVFPPLPPPPPMPSMEPPRVPFLPPTPDEMKQRQTSNPNDAKLIAMLTSFLLAHPLGATFEYLTSYIRSMLPYATPQAVNAVLMKHSDIFARQGADRWSFVLFDIVKKEGH